MREWKREIEHRLSAAGHDIDTDILEELAQHAAATWTTARAEGLETAEADARVLAEIDAWVRDGARLRHRPSRAAAIPPPPAVESSRSLGIMQDTRYAVRLFFRKPSYALLIVATMALGIAATTTLFSVAYGVLMRPLPWAEADRIVVLKETRGGNRPRFGSLSTHVYHAWKSAPAGTIEAIALWGPRSLTLTGAGDPERLRAMGVTASFFDVLRLRPLAGRFFDAADEQAGGVVVLSERLWRQRFGADPAVVGRIIQLDGASHRVAGVLGETAAYPDADTLAWVPVNVPVPQPNSLSMMEGLARLKAGATASQAAAEMTARSQFPVSDSEIGGVINAVFGGNGAVDVSATPLRTALTADVRQPLIVLLIAVGLLYATATGNVASLQLAHATTRRRELAIRAALGANTARVTRQLLVESLLLSLTGGFAGLTLALLVQRLIPVALPADFPRLAAIRIDAPVMFFALGVSVLAGVAFGLLPARMRADDLQGTLKEDGTSPAGGGSRTRVARARLTIMGAQVAIACVLLVGASLLGRSFIALLNADRGFDPANVLTARVQMPAFAYPAERRAQMIDQIVERVRAVSGVTAASFSEGAPLGIVSGTSFGLDGRQVQASHRRVTPGYFEAMGMRLAAGRDFNAEDELTGRPVFIVNRTFARQHLRQDPVGQRIRGGFEAGIDEWEVVGVVEDVRQRGATEPVEPEVYRYQPKKDRRGPTAPTLIIRTAGDPMALAPTVRALVRQVDPMLIVDSVMSMEDRVMTGLARPRLYAIILGGFAVLALLVAGVGLLAVMSYSVSQRGRELAVRMALGARRTDIVRLVLLQALAVAAAGLVIGIPAALMLTRLLAKLLYGVPQHDPLTFVAVPLILVGAVVVSCIPAAVRAVRVDPLRVLRAG